MNKHYSQKKSIIIEKPGIEETISILNSNKKNNLLQMVNINNIENNSKSNLFNPNTSLSSRTLKVNDSYSLKFSKDEDNELINSGNDENEENESNITSGERYVNKEINPGEEIIMNNEISLFSKKFNSSYPKNALNNNNIENKNSKMKVLLNHLLKESEHSLIEEKSNENKENSDSDKKDDNKEFSYDNNSINYNNYLMSNKHILSSINSQNSQSNEMNINKKGFDNGMLSINNNISFEYKSCYENCNLLSHEKLIKDKNFQEKLKKFLKGEVITTNRHSGKNLRINSPIDSNQKETSKIKYLNTMINYKEKGILKALSLQGSPICNKNKKAKIEKSVSFIDSKKENFNGRRKGILRTSSFSENNLLQYKIKNKYDMDIENNSNKYSNKLIKKRKSIKKQRFLSRQDLIYSYNNTEMSAKESKHRKYLSRESWHFSPMSPLSKTKKKKIGLLSQIDLNMEKTNQNLNNPDQFYSNYFNYLLEEKINYSGFFGEKKDDDESKMKKEKIINRNVTLRKIV